MVVSIADTLDREAGGCILDVARNGLELVDINDSLVHMAVGQNQNTGFDVRLDGCGGAKDGADITKTGGEICHVEWPNLFDDGCNVSLICTGIIGRRKNNFTGRFEGDNTQHIVLIQNVEHCTDTALDIFEFTVFAH